MQESLVHIRGALDQAEQERLSPLACPSARARRRQALRQDELRQAFALDADRILHSRAYSRYRDKTQVFSLVDNDHVTHRIVHVQLVSRIARTVGRFLGLNEDLIEAIALGHDIGHPPFGHQGERILAEICVRHGLPAFRHNVQGVHFLERFERRGQGLNLSLQVLDGILCHDGESDDTGLEPSPGGDFADFDTRLRDMEEDPALSPAPMTIEGCVVRLADVIAYVGRDMEDAVELGLISRDDLPRSVKQSLGQSNGSIVYALVSDLIGTSLGVRQGTSKRIGFSAETGAMLLELKRFNYQHIYHDPRHKADQERVRRAYERLFARYMERLEQGKPLDGRKFPASMSEDYLHGTPPAAVVRDYIAGMTDAYFLRRAEAAAAGGAA